MISVFALQLDSYPLIHWQLQFLVVLCSFLSEDKALHSGLYLGQDFSPCQQRNESPPDSPPLGLFCLPQGRISSPFLLPSAVHTSPALELYVRPLVFVLWNHATEPVWTPANHHGNTPQPPSPLTLKQVWLQSAPSIRMLLTQSAGQWK